jgi:orotidine-5'-phosphate decarboxylase
MTTLKSHERLFVALDTPDAEAAGAPAERLGGRVGGFKVGLELFSAASGADRLVVGRPITGAADPLRAAAAIAAEIERAAAGTTG